MPLTPNSAVSPYLSAQQFLTGGFVDPRWVADKISVDGNRVGVNPDGSINVSAVAAYVPPGAPAGQPPTVQNILLMASGQVESACLRGGRYQVADLLGLLPNPTAVPPVPATAGGLFLQWLVGTIAKCITFQLRPEPGVPPLPECLQAMDWLEQLGNGTKIFGFAETQQAGVMTDVIDTPTIIQQRNEVVQDAYRLFGHRNNMEPGSLGGG
jgi:hypothetical protein